MSKLSIADKTFLEAALGMDGGYVLDFNNTLFAQFFDGIEIDIFDERYAEYGTSKANRLRALWQIGSNSEVAAALNALVDYAEARKAVAADPSSDLSEEHATKIRAIARDLDDAGLAASSGASVPITTEATVTANRISIVIHEELYSHISPYLDSGDYFHAVEESYKLVREKLRELTGHEKASDVFNNSAQNVSHYSALFGRATPSDAAEADFFRGVGYLHLGVQHLRNEKAHTPASPVEPNLALHYISLASLAYDLITRYVSEETILEIEDLVREKRRGYRSANSFYRDFEHGRWLQGFATPSSPSSFESVPVRKALKEKWLGEANFSRSWDHSNVVFMQLELVADQLTEGDVDDLIDLPTEDAYGNDQQAGLEPFLAFLEEEFPAVLSDRARACLAELRNG